MHIDCSKLPDPLNPQPDDVYTSPGPTHVVIVTMASYRSDDEADHMRVVRDGTTICIPTNDFMPLLISLGVRPWGRLDRSEKARPAISRDPEIVAERLAAMGPHLRALREQYGLSMGDLARALGCPPARLSMLELGEPDPVREGAGVREDEGRAALAELLTETVSQALGYALGEDDGLSGLDRSRVWEAIHAMLVTGPARAAMSTILKARGEAELAANPGTSAMDLSNLNPETAAKRVLAELLNDGHLESACKRCQAAGETARATMEQAKAVEQALVRAFKRLVVAPTADKLGEVQYELEQALATDEAQRPIRLHG